MKQNRLRNLLWWLGPFAICFVGSGLWKSCWISLVGYQCWLAIGLFKNRGRWKFRELMIGWKPLPAFLLLLANVGFFFFLAAAMNAQGWEGERLRTLLAEFGIVFPSAFLLIILFCTTNPILEELFWRSVFHEEAPGWADLFFGGYHAIFLGPMVGWVPAVVSAVGLMATGQIWRRIYRWSGGLSLPIWSHAMADLVIVVVIARLAGWL